MKRDLLTAAIVASLMHAVVLTVLPGRDGPRQRPGAVGKAISVTLMLPPEPAPTRETESRRADRPVPAPIDSSPLARHPAPAAATAAPPGTTMAVSETSIQPAALDVRFDAADLPADGRPDPSGPPPPEPGPLHPGAVEVTLPSAAAPAAGLAGGDAQPVAVENAPPRYPALARRRGHEGVVLLEVEVLPTGRSGDVRVLTSSGHAILDREAIRAVRRWRFEPARRGDRPLVDRIEVPIEFRLEE